MLVDGPAPATSSGHPSTPKAGTPYAECLVSVFRTEINFNSLKSAAVNRVLRRALSKSND